MSFQDGFVASLKSGKELDPRFEKDLKAFKGNVKDRLNIYRQNIFHIHREAAQDVFPALLSLVGEKAFGALIRDYFWQLEQCSADINDFGDGLWVFMSSLDHGPSHEYLPDVAQLEWAMHACQQVDSEPSARWEDIQQNLAGARFAPAAALHLIASSFPLDLIWQAAQSSDQKTLEVTPGTFYFSISKMSGASHLERLDERSYQLLRKLQDGEDLGSAVSKLYEESEMALLQADLLKMISQEMLHVSL